MFFHTVTQLDTEQVGGEIRDGEGGQEEPAFTTSSGETSTEPERQDLLSLLPLHLYTVCQKREQVLQRERGSELGRKPRLLKLMTSTSERVSPALHCFGGRTCRLCCLGQMFLILECVLSYVIGGET